MANANTHAQLPLHTDTSTLLMVDHRGGPRGAPRGCAGGHQASLQRARGHTPPCAAVPIPTAEPGPPAAPAAGPGTYWEAPLGHGRGGCPSLGHGSVQPGARGRHRVACDSGNRQPQNREAEPQAVGGLLPPAPHSQGRVGGPPPTNPEPLGNRGHGGLQGLLQAGVAAEPSTALADAASPSHDHVLRDAWGPHPAQLYPSAAPAPPNHSLRQLPSQHCSHVLPAVGGGGCRRKEPLGKAKKIPAGGAAAAASSLPACPCSWRGRQRSPAWYCVEEPCARASSTPHTPTSTGCSCSWTSLGGCLRQISHSCPSLPPCCSLPSLGTVTQ